MNEVDMHGAIRGLYEGIPDPIAWHDSLRAQQLGVRQETARTQRKAVFHKTGCNRKAQPTHPLAHLGATLDLA
ncbi:hypothetical protein [Cupriavidus nantongensis]|uniref:hypothetical protein n=1 Tax=Cupriavidus nantongensis TaxID=1796606 RepID=UPI00358E9ADC